MSSIQKIAVYDARMQQDEPAYAVQKGALSVSVAPFSAISASSSQMTFQVLVPSLNVFVDRKLQVSAGLNFTANLFYSGQRSASVQAVITTVNTAITGIINAGSNVLTLNGPPILNGAAAQPLLPGTQVFHVAMPANTFVVGTTGNANQYILNNISLLGVTTAYVSVANPGTGGFGFLVPWTYDVPDPVMGVQQGVTYDSPFDGAVNSSAFQPMGYCTAVSPKDLAYCSFPLQSALTNMTATLNDCTVTTNGDTLKEQLLLTMTPENVKQRTTPTGVDTYSWGRDDALSSSGNFSSYSIVNSQGDVPNGAYPTSWYADATQNVPLTSVGRIIATATPNVITATYPFLTPGVYSFGLGTASANLVSGGASGCGFYIAPTNASNVTGFTAQNVLVPFVNNQPVWTTGFPGGDLLCFNNLAIGSTYIAGSSAINTVDQSPGFTIVSSGAGTILTLLRNVPPYCMVGAKLYYTTSTGGIASITAYGNSIGQAGTSAPIQGFVSNILSGGLGVAGSTYNVCTGTVFTVTQLQTLSLQAGCQAGVPLPVFGQLNVVEPLVISPMIWADSAEFQTVGLYGMTNMQFILNFAPLGTCYAALNPAVVGSGATGFQGTASLPLWVDDLTRPTQNVGNILRSSNIRTVLSDLAFSTQTTLNGPWTSPTLFATFLTPGPDVTLPLVSTVPYTEFPRYVQTITGSFVGPASIRTQTISLTSIPDMVMIYVKPATKGPSQLDQYIPIDNIQVTFDNFSNLCSGFQQFNLYESAVAAGLDLDWHQWRGYSQGALASTSRVSLGSNAVNIPPTFKQNSVTQLSGGPILLRMGQDITLSPGLAPGCLGNYSFQATVRLPNAYGFYDYLTAVTITVIAINTGFFETVRGQSAIRKTILNSADVEAATPESGVTRSQLNRMVGRGSYMRGASHFVNNAAHLRQVGKLAGPMASALARQGSMAGMKRGSGIM